MHKMGLDKREHHQHLKLSEYSDSLINFSYFPQSDRASVQIKQIQEDQLLIINLGDAEIRSLISIYQELKFTQEIKKESWKKWNSWVLDEEEIMQIAESMGLDYNYEVKEQVERIAEKFKNKLSNSESDYWTGYIADSIKEVLEQ